MKDDWRDLMRMVSAGGVYALASVAQRGISFVLLPIYTRYIDPFRYGALELLNAFSSVVFALLVLGLPSAIVKCYHRDCKTDEDRARIFATALLLAFFPLAAGGGLLFLFSRTVGQWLIAVPDAAALVRLTVASGVSTGAMAIVLALLRAQERSRAFATLSVLQFLAAAALNVVLVVVYGMGVRGVLWGNLVSQVITLLVGLIMVGRVASWSFESSLSGPLLRFGLLLLPVLVATWVMDLSDRYVLKLYRDLDEVAVYSVGYKIGMVLQLALVWPFQLAWPAVSFRISNRRGHQRTFARTLTYLTLALAFGVVGLSLLSRDLIPALLGRAYIDAHRVVPLVALAYALNGVHYCTAAGVHISGRTRYFPYLSALAALTNLALNFALVPSMGMIGAMWATVAAFFVLAATTFWLSQSSHPVPWEWGRLSKTIVAAALVYGLGSLVPDSLGDLAAAGAHTVLVVFGFPALLFLFGFPSVEERGALMRVLPWAVDSKRRPSG